MIRFRITTDKGDGVEQTWVLLPDAESALMQAEEHAQRERGVQVRVYREEFRGGRELIREFVRPR
jgi:hypothetical protein